MEISQTKSISKRIFQSINKDTHLINEDCISIVCSSGVSNNIYKVSYSSNDVTLSKDQLLFRWFGKISDLVDRDLERKIIQGLNERSLGPAIIETDYKTYRVEEYLVGTRNLTNSELFDEEIENQIFSIFMKFYEIDDNLEFASLSKIYNTKDALCDAMLNHSSSNFFNFYNRVNERALSSFDKFKSEFFEDKDYWINNHEYESMIEKINKVDKIIIEGFSKMVYLLPEIPILVLSHNDAHAGNILIQGDKVYLIDHEFAFYNYLGFEVANYLLESTFTLDWSDYPYYKQFTDHNVFLKEEYFLKYKNFISNFFEKYNKKLAEKGVDVNAAQREYSTKETYINLIAAASIYWSLHGIYYLEYEVFKSRKVFDYFNYSLTRYSVYEGLIESNKDRDI